MKTAEQLAAEAPERAKRFIMEDFYGHMKEAAASLLDAANAMDKGFAADHGLLEASSPNWLRHDLYTLTASCMFRCKVEEVSKLQRQIAKMELLQRTRVSSEVPGNWTEAELKAEVAKFDSQLSDLWHEYNCSQNDE